MTKKYLITTAIDYVNDVLHIGHAYQKILADALARFYRQLGHEVFFLTGTDEHGSKTEEAARVQGLTPQEFADEISSKDKEQLACLNISYNRFVRTTDKDHIKTAQEFYLRICAAGDIYKGSYTGIYCVGCEDFLTEKDLIDGKCPEHPRQEPTKLTEENYFFKWSKYESFLRENLETNPRFLIPESRRNEMLSFLDQGLQDIPFTRPKARVEFGIEVPHDPGQTLYVWVEALTNYITGNPPAWEDSETTIIHFLGKNNVRFHALLWPAMLKSAGLRLPNTVYGHDFFTINGTKISKSLGNIIRPTDLANQFGADAVRYFFLRYGPLRSDVDVSITRLKEVYNADLANGLGNLVARTAKLCEVSGVSFDPVEFGPSDQRSFYQRHMENFRVDNALSMIWSKIGEADKFVDRNRVWQQQNEKKVSSLQHLVQEVRRIAVLLQPFLPETAERIRTQFHGPTISSQPSLFPRAI